MWMKRNGREEYKGIFCKYSQVDTKARSGKSFRNYTTCEIFEKWEMTSKFCGKEFILMEQQ